MDLPSAAFLPGLSERFVWLSGLPLTYIGLGAIVPLLVALMARDRMAILVTGLFALMVILLCTTVEMNWSLLATFEAAAAFPLALVAIIRQRRSRSVHDQELNELSERLKVLEAWEQRRIMASLRDGPGNSLETTPPMAPAKVVRDSVTTRPTIAAEMVSPLKARGD
jgi:membrane protein implicated in regulation of membrane protease activity